MRWRVVCALRDVMLIFWPTSALSSVDLPTLGRPTMATVPQRVSAPLACDHDRSGPPGRSLAFSASSMWRAASCSAARRERPRPVSAIDNAGMRALDLERLRMRLARGAHDAIRRHRDAARLQPLLQLGLGVLRPGMRLAGRDHLAEQAAHQLERALEAAVDIGGADQRLERIGQDRRPLRTAARAPRLRTAASRRAGRASARRGAGSLRAPGAPARA